MNLDLFSDSNGNDAARDEADASAQIAHLKHVLHRHAHA
ncbi:MAG: hypothetical protein RL706_513, partial [Pseudomonadota bacterium]